MAVEAFKILGTIGLKGANETKQELDEVTGHAERSSSKLGGILGKIGKGVGTAAKVIGTGIGVAAGAIGGLTVKAISMGGELEQNMGGSEAVFGKHAGKMQDTAKKAFSNMGLSTSDYLATANKMGALFQGAGFDVEKSMTMSQDAMQRAADVASIMGIDTSAAMEAVAGAAKGNFTMMDNLGVAMNETTLANYALEKGMKKSYDQMTQQEKIGVAMEMFLDKTAYAAGNYAKENETLAGALGTAKAAFNNFLSGSGTVDDVVSSFTNAGEVIVKNVKELFPKLMTGITQLVNKLVPQIPPLLKELLPSLITGAVSLVNGLVAAMPQIISALMAALPALLAGITQIMNSIIEALPQLMEMIMSALPTLIPALIDGIMTMVVTLCNNFADIIQPIIDYLPDIIINIVEALMNNLPALIQGLIQLVLGIVNAIPQIISGLIDALPQIISMVIDGLLAALPELISGLIQVVGGVVSALPQILASLKKGIVELFITIWEQIQKVFSPLSGWFGDTFKKGKEAATKAWDNVQEAFKKDWEDIKGAFSKVGGWFKDQFTQGRKNAEQAFSTMGKFFSNVWKGITKAFSNVGSWFKKQFEQGKNNAQQAFSTFKNFFSNVWSGIKKVFSSVGSWFKNIFTSAKNGVQNAWSSVKNFFSNIWSGIKNTASNAISGVKNIFTNAWSSIKSKTTSIWNGIKNAITTPIKNAVNTVKGYISNIKNAFSNIKTKIKMPHIKVKNASWNPKDWIENGLPKFSVEWYKDGGILTKPAVFDYNPATNTARVGGEAGAEAVAPIDKLMNYVQTAVRTENDGLLNSVQRIYDLLTNFLPQIAEGMNVELVLDGDTLVARLIPKIDKQLGTTYARKARYA